MACARLDCLKRWVCAEFQAGTCNIIVKDAVLRKTRKECTSIFLTTEHMSADCRSSCKTQTLSEKGVSRKCKVFLKRFEIPLEESLCRRR